MSFRACALWKRARLFNRHSEIWGSESSEWDCMRTLKAGVRRCANWMRARFFNCVTNVEAGHMTMKTEGRQWLERAFCYKTWGYRHFCIQLEKSRSRGRIPAEKFTNPPLPSVLRASMSHAQPECSDGSLPDPNTAFGQPGGSGVCLPNQDMAFAQPHPGVGFLPSEIPK